MDEEKYVSKRGDVIHCPKCRGVIFRDYKKDHVVGEISFRIRCPHCAKIVVIRIKDGIIVEE